MSANGGPLGRLARPDEPNDWAYRSRWMSRQGGRSGLTEFRMKVVCMVGVHGVLFAGDSLLADLL